MRSYIVKNLRVAFLRRQYILQRLKNGDLLYLRFLRSEIKNRFYNFHKKDYFGRCIRHRNKLFKKSVLLRKTVKLNEIENLFVLSSPFVSKIQYIRPNNKSDQKNLLYLRRKSPKRSKLRFNERFFRKFQASWRIKNAKRSLKQKKSKKLSKRKKNK